LKKYGVNLGKHKIRKLRRNCGGGATFHIPCLVVQHVVTPFPAIPLEFFPGKYGVFSDEHGEGSMRICPE
jgi:hypothetical protein